MWQKKKKKKPKKPLRLAPQPHHLSWKMSLCLIRVHSVNGSGLIVPQREDEYVWWQLVEQGIYWAHPSFPSGSERPPPKGEQLQSSWVRRCAVKWELFTAFQNGFQYGEHRILSMSLRLQAREGSDKSERYTCSRPC